MNRRLTPTFVLLLIRVLVAIAWGFGAALAITIIPLVESKDEIYGILNGMWHWITRKELIPSADEVAKHEFEHDSDDTPLKQPDEEAPDTSVSKSSTSETKPLSSSVKAASVEIDGDSEHHA